MVSNDRKCCFDIVSSKAGFCYFCEFGLKNRNAKPGQFLGCVLLYWFVLLVMLARFGNDEKLMNGWFCYYVGCNAKKISLLPQ